MNNLELRTQEKRERLPYETPAIIYEGLITTRAGSPPGGGAPDPGEGLDPVDLFGNNG